jgi:hypothetical protein
LRYAGFVALRSGIRGLLFQLILWQLLHNLLLSSIIELSTPTAARSQARTGALANPSSSLMMVYGELYTGKEHFLAAQQPCRPLPQAS